MATTGSGRLAYNASGQLVPIEEIQNSLGYSSLLPSFNASMQMPPSGYRPGMYNYDKPITDTSGKTTGYELQPQYYQPIYQQSYQNYNVDTPYGASQYGKGVQYLQNPFSYAPPGVSYGSQGGMGGMYNPFTYRGGNISASSGMGYGGYGSYGTQTPGAQTGGTQTGGTNPIFGPGGMFPALTGTQTGTQTGTPTGIDALIAAMQAYINGSPTATRPTAQTQGVPTQTTATQTTPAATSTSTTKPSGGFTAGPGPVVGPSGGFTTGGTGTPTGAQTGVSTVATPASNYTPTKAQNEAFITWYMKQPSITGKLNGDILKEQGITDPLGNAALLNMAAERNTIANGRANVLNSAGIPSSYDDFAPWTSYTKETTPTNPSRSTALGVNGPMQDDSNASIPDLTNPFTDTGAPTTSTAVPALSDLDQYALEKYGRPLTDTEKQVLSSMPLTDAQSIMDTSIANWNASQAAQNTAPSGGPDTSATGVMSVPGASGPESGAYTFARGGIASLLRRR